MGLSKNIAFGVLIVLLFVLAAATVLEKTCGREFVTGQLYGSWWFAGLWAILAVAAFIYIFREKLYRSKAVFLLHVSLGTILLGAFITFVSAERGYIHIRQNETVNTFTSEADDLQRRLPFDLKLLLFEVEYHRNTDKPADFISYLRVDGEVCKVSMNKIHVYQGYRFYQLSYDSDELGSTLLVNYDPYGIAVTYAGYILLAIAVVWLLFLRISWENLLRITVFIACLWYYISQMNPMTPILRSPMLAAHVSVIMTSYALLILIAIFSVVALCSEKKRDELYRWNIKLLFPALFLLSIGIFLGAVWANMSWGRYWGWDAKETWALITMLIYAFPMHRNSIRRFRNPRFFHLYCSLALLAVAMTFFGVSFLLGGMHSYV
ncbi:MAG: cytochrome c biogenesis protein CcsA [Prevotella sp.]|jgi:ABC-type transport system involved in cytochrome c biogenesis permease subunit|nr:cytochrome c biogenesis protein CcsA [Prevotella sp.]